DFPGSVSSRSSGSSWSGLLIRALASGSIGGSSSKTTDTEADRRQCRFVHSARIGDLQEESFARLLESRPLKNNHSVATLAGTQPASAETEISHRQLLSRAPFLLDLPAQLNLRRHDFDRVARWIDY